MRCSLDLKCPCSKKINLNFGEGFCSCADENCCHSESNKPFKIVSGVPVLISPENTDTLCNPQSVSSYISRIPKKFSSVKRILAGNSVITRRNCGTFVNELKKRAGSPKVLVIGSGERGAGTSLLWKDPEIEIHGVDIYASDSVDIVCDGHYLPLDDTSYDGVWIQAVLEHVVQPDRVVDEIYRVLKPGGLVYAETPFMQQVHEGAYDFTRFTVLGHRYLFKRFDAIAFGGNQGPEVVLAWSIRYFVLGITRSLGLARASGLIAGLLLRPFGYLMSKESTFDGPSGVYFLGAKTVGNSLRHSDLPDLYKGAMR